MKKATPIDALREALKKAKFVNPIAKQEVTRWIEVLLPICEKSRQQGAAWKGGFLNLGAIFPQDAQAIYGILNSSAKAGGKTSTKKRNHKPSKIVDVSGDGVYDSEGCDGCGNGDEEETTQTKEKKGISKISEAKTIEEILEFYNNDKVKIREAALLLGVVIGNTKDPVKIAKRILAFLDEPLDEEE